MAMPNARDLAALKKYGVPTPKKAPAAERALDLGDIARTSEMMRAMDTLKDLARAMIALAERDMPTPIVNVNVPAPVVNIKPAEVTVRPDIRVDSPRFDVHVPPMKVPTPNIRVDAPVVNVTNQVPATQDIRIISTPAVDVRRDNAGRISGLDRRDG